RIMNRFLFLLLLLLAPTALAASPSVLVTVSDFTLDFSAPGRVVRLSPTTAGSSQRSLSDSSGQVTFASVSPGIWTLTIEGDGVPIGEQVFTNESGVIHPITITNQFLLGTNDPTAIAGGGAALSLGVLSDLDGIATPIYILTLAKTNDTASGKYGLFSQLGPI